jgi:hypothetical protein
MNADEEKTNRRGAEDAEKNKFLLFFSRLTVISCTSFNHGYPDSDFFGFVYKFMKERTTEAQRTQREFSVIF